MPNPITATRDYFQHSVAELKKVAWPSREMTIRYSSLVVAVSLVLAAFFAALDFGLQTAVNAGLAHKTTTSASQSAQIPDVTPTVETTGSQDGKVQVETEKASPTDVAPKPSNNGGLQLPDIDTSKK
jgi:preprotein translocase SecE subunit